MSLEGWKAFFEIGGVILLLLTFTFGAGALIVNDRLNAIQAEELADFKIKFEGEQQKTALAQKEAAEAKQLAGGFERDISLANQRAAEAQETAKGFERDIAVTNEKAAEAGKQAEAERLERVRLEAKLLPRRLTGAQIEQLGKRLKLAVGQQSAGIVIISAMADGESSDLADDFDSAFKGGTFNTRRNKSRVTDERGIQIGTVEGTASSGWVDEVAKFVGEIGIEVTPTSFRADDHSTSPWFEKNVLYLVVNHKPELAKSRR
jgi:hypothetical protein